MNVSELIDTARDLFFAEKYVEAAERANEALDLLKSDSTHKLNVEYAEAKRILASIPLLKDEWDKAIPLMKEYLVSVEKLQEQDPLYMYDVLNRSQWLVQLGYALAKQKRFSEAEEKYRESIQYEIRALGPDTLNVDIAKFALGKMYFEQKKYVDALHVFESLSKMFIDAGKDPGSLGYALGFEAQTLAKLEELDACEGKYRMAMEVFELNQCRDLYHCFVGSSFAKFLSEIKKDKQAAIDVLAKLSPLLKEQQSLAEKEIAEILKYYSELKKN